MSAARYGFIPATFRGVDASIRALKIGFFTWRKTILTAGILLVAGQGISHAAKVSVKFTPDGKGALSATAYKAKGNQIALSLGFAPSTGQSLTVVKNTGIGFISGKFTNLAQGQSVKLTFNGREYPFIADYYGGTGNDLVLHWSYRDLFAWGDNTSGQLGVEEQFSLGSNIPAEVISTGALVGKKVLRIACGGSHSIALCADGSLAAWGENSSGQLGDGTLVKSPVPVTVPHTGALAGKTPVAVAAGLAHTVVLCSDGSVVTWGRNASGQLGNASLVDSRTPVVVKGKFVDGFTLVAVSAGDYFTAALRSDGHVVTWGNNAAGSLGNGNNKRSTKPVLVDRKGVLAKRSVVAIASGGSHTLAICSDGTLAAWGAGGRGQLGNNARINRNIPVLVKESKVLAKKKPSALAAGASHSLVFYSDWTAAAWGANESGQLGDNSTTDRIIPVALPASGALAGRKVLSLAAGGLQSLALRDDRVPLTWGNNSAGQLGIGSYENSKVPAGIPLTESLLGSRFVALAAGAKHAVGVTALPLSGDSGLTNLTLDKGVMNLAFSTERSDYVASVPARGDLTLVVKPQARSPLARVKVNGVSHVPGSAGVPVKFTAAQMIITVQVTAENGVTSDYRINLKPSGNEYVQFLQPGTTGLTREAYDATDLHASVQLDFEPAAGTSLMVLNNTGLNQIRGRFLEFGHGDTVVLNRGGRQYQFIANYHGGDGNDLLLEWKRRTLAAWGLNTAGQLGNGTQVQSPEPVAVKDDGALAGKVVLRVFSGTTYTVALCSDGTLAAWGGNTQGQLGDGTTTNRSTPVVVDMSGALNGKTVIAVETGSGRTRALCSDGTVAQWGGGITSAALMATAQTMGSRKIVAVASNESSAFEDIALCSDGSLFRDPFGDGVPVEQTEALAGKVVCRIARGNSHVLALCTDGSLVSWGENGSGQLGIGAVTGPVPPTLVDRSGVLAGKTVVSIAVSASRSFVVCSDGTLAGWGSGQLGTGNSSSSLPVAINGGSASGKSFISAGAGTGHSMAICSDGTLLAWGQNTQGQLGTGATSAPQSVPVEVFRSGFLSGTAALQASPAGNFTTALFATPADSTLSSLEVAEGSLTPSFSPSVTEYTLSVSALQQTLAITPTARYSWSKISIDGVDVPSGTTASPVAINGRPHVDVVVTGEHLGTTSYRLNMPGNVQASYANAAHVPVVANGFVAAGWNVDLGLQFAPEMGASLTVVRNTDLAFIKGEFANLAQGQEVWLSHNGTSYRFIANYYGGSGNDLVLEWPYRKISSWGWNLNGQLGNNSLEESSSIPVAVDESGVLSGKTVMTVSGGAGHSVALCVDGTVATWGGGGRGQLGAGSDMKFTRIPVNITDSGYLAGKRVVAVATASDTSLALCSDGTVAGWGWNVYGQVGNGATVNSFVPVQVDHTGVLAGKSVVSVSVGGSHCLALCSDGTVVSWGMNNRGNLGDGTKNAFSSVPVDVKRDGVLIGKKVVAITAGLESGAALCSDGVLAEWGGVFNHNVPALVHVGEQSVGKKPVSLSQGANDDVLALCSDGTMLIWRGLAGSLEQLTHPVLLSGKSVTSVGSGYNLHLATCSDGTVVSWGQNNYGQLGRVESADWIGAVPLDGVLAGHKGLSVAGAFHSLLISAVEAPAGVAPAAARAVMAPAAGSQPAVRTPLVSPQSGAVSTGTVVDVPAQAAAVENSSDSSDVANSTSLGVSTLVPPSGNCFVFEYRRKPMADGTVVETFEYTSDMIFWDELEILPDTDPRVVLGEVDSNGEQTVRIHIPVSAGALVIGRPKVSAP